MENNISKDAKIRVYWDDKPENYSRDNKNKIRQYFNKKYGVDKDNILVVFRPVKIDVNGNTIELDGVTIDNIMDLNYQRSLFKEWLDREGKDVDFQRILKLDDKINAELSSKMDDLTHKKWELKWIFIDNFLSFGSKNYVNFSKMNGLTIVNSNPSNQGGKTTFSHDAIKFLLFGKTSKTDKNEQIFNEFSNENTVVVRGMLDYGGGKEIIIERIMKRSKKRTSGWNINNNVNYYQIMPDGEEILLNEEDAIKTTQEITKVVGTEEDFDLTVLSTADNLESLIHAKPTESGKIFTKFIGLEVIEEKETIVRQMYNTYAKTMKSNIYNISDLDTEIKDNELLINENHEMINVNNEEINNLLLSITKENENRDILLSSKKSIDVKLSTLNPSKLELEIENITKKGTNLKNDIVLIEKSITDIGDITYDEVYFVELTNKKNDLVVKISINENNINSSYEIIKQLKNGEICPTCKRLLDNVDNALEIKAEETKIKDLEKTVNSLKKDLEKTSNELISLSNKKELVDKKDKLELKRDRIEVELKDLRTQVKEKMLDLKSYNNNIESIDYNKNIDIKTEKIKTDIIILETKKNNLTASNSELDNKIYNCKNKIKENKNLISQIETELDIEKIYKIYIDMIGKKGISKLILRSVLPIINSELQRLMDDIVDFSIEITINDKNEIQLLIIKDDIEKLLKSGSGLEKTMSALALRCVLGKVSTLSMPNFITFDEVLGKVAQENIEKIKPMFDKIKDMYDVVFLITHNDLVKDWSDNIITIEKINNISTIKIQ